MSHRDDTQRILRTYLPSLEVVQEVVGRHRGIAIGFYDSRAGSRDPWLGLELPGGGFVKLTDCHDPEVLESVLARIASPIPHVVCPNCRYGVPRAQRPYGKMRCPRCYRQRRDFVTMVWDGVEGWGKVVRSIAGHSI